MTDHPMRIFGPALADLAAFVAVPDTYPTLPLTRLDRQPVTVEDFINREAARARALSDARLAAARPRPRPPSQRGAWMAGAVIGAALGLLIGFYATKAFPNIAATEAQAEAWLQ